MLVFKTCVVNVGASDELGFIECEPHKRFFALLFSFPHIRRETGDEQETKTETKRVFRFQQRKKRKRDFRRFARKMETKQRALFPVVSTKSSVLHGSIMLYLRPLIFSQPSRSARFAILEIWPLLSFISSASSEQQFSPFSIHCRKIAIESAS